MVAKNDNNIILYIRLIYMIFIFIWIFIIFWFEMLDIGFIAYLLILIPFIVFISGCCNAAYISIDDECQVFEASFLAIGLLVLMPLVNWMKECYTGNKHYFMSLILLGIAMTLLSVIDIWLPTKYMRLLKHLRVCFETIAVTIFLIVLYVFYINMVC